MKFRLKQKIKSIIFPHLPAMINPDGHLPPALKKMGLFILRNLYPKAHNNFSVIRIMTGPLKGKKMIVNLIPENGATDTEYIVGYRQEREEIELFEKLIKQGQTIWDVGIYRGFYSLLFSQLTGPSGKVLAFDIEKENCKVVNEIIRLNGISNIKTYNYGLSNENTEAEFISSPSSNSRLIMTYRGYYTESPVLSKGESIKKVQLRTLNSFVEEFGYTDLIKIDIDGAELFALDAADRIFEKDHVLFIIESHNPKTDQKITDFFNSNQCFVYSINEKRFFDKTELYWGNMIGCKNILKLENLLA